MHLILTLMIQIKLKSKKYKKIITILTDDPFRLELKIMSQDVQTIQRERTETSIDLYLIVVQDQ